MRRLTGDFPAAAQALEQALGIYRDLGDRLGQANALSDLGAVWRATGEYPAAAQSLEQALGIYRDLDDRHGQANALRELGVVLRVTGEYPAAAQSLEQALGIYRDLGDRLGQANTLTDLAVARRRTGDYPAAAQALEQALGIHRDLGDRLGQANALSDLGDVRRATGEYAAAAQALEQALGIYRDLDDRPARPPPSATSGTCGGGRVITRPRPRPWSRPWASCATSVTGAARPTALNERGTLHRVSGELAQAEGCHQQALELARAIASSWDEAHALAGLGRCAVAAGRTTEAEDLLRQALEIFQRIGAAEAADVAAELEALSSTMGKA